jgi:hypothetical protein
MEVYPHEVEFYLYRSILPGYAWIFPVGGDRANIGLGMRLDHYRKAGRNLKAMLEDFLAMPDINKRLKKGWVLTGVGSWPLNFGSQKHLQYVFDGASWSVTLPGLSIPSPGAVFRGAFSPEGWLQKQYMKHCKGVIRPGQV